MNADDHRFLSVAICDNLWRGLRIGHRREKAQEAPKKPGSEPGLRFCAFSVRQESLVDRANPMR